MSSTGLGWGRVSTVPLTFGRGRCRRPALRRPVTLTTALVETATGAVGGETTELDPYRFVAVTITRILAPLSESPRW